MTPGALLLRFAERFCTPATKNRLIDPMIADLRWEHAQVAGRPWLQCWMLLRGYAGFWMAIGIHVPASTVRTTVGVLKSNAAAIRRAGAVAAAAVLVATTVLVFEPFTDLLHYLSAPTAMWFAVLIAPSSLPLTVPLGVLVGVLAGFRGRMVTHQVSASIVVIGLLGSLVTFGTMRWVIPNTQRVFRMEAASLSHIGNPTAISTNPSEREASTKAGWDRARRGGRRLLLSYIQWSYVGGPLAFALFALGVTARRCGRGASAVLAVMGLAAYIAAVIGVTNLPTAMLGGEWTLVAFAGLPFVTLVLASLVLMSLGANASQCDGPG